MGRPKASIVLEDGRSLSARALDLLSTLGAPLVVVGHGEGVPRREGLALVRDLREDQGPLGALEALLGSGVAARYLVLPVDMPRVTASMLRALLDADDAAAAAVLQVEGAARFAPFPLRIDEGALDEVRARLDAGDRRLTAAVSALAPARVPLPASEADRLANVNAPGDLRGL